MVNRAKNELAFAIVGCGRIGQRHAEQTIKVGRLIGVCDIRSSLADSLAKQYGCEAFADISQMLAALGDDADVIAICTPNGLHCEHTIKAFTAGFHVLCEKPMAITVQECEEMIKAGERANRRLFVVKQNRYNPPVEHLKNLLESGKMGKVLSAHLNCYWNRNADYYRDSWRGTRAMDGGILYTQFSHFIDLLYWMVGDVKSVLAYTDNYCHADSIEFEDTGVAILRFYNGAIGSINFTINSYDRNMEGSLTLFCEYGSVKIGGQYLNEIEYENVRGLERSNLRTGRPPNEYGQYEGSMSNHEDVYRNVVSVLSADGAIGTIGLEGLKTVEIIDKIYAAARLAARN